MVAPLSIVSLADAPRPSADDTADSLKKLTLNVGGTIKKKGVSAGLAKVGRFFFSAGKAKPSEDLDAVKQGTRILLAHFL